MGFISNYASKGIDKDRRQEVGQSPRTIRQAVEAGQATWREIFNITKEDSHVVRQDEPLPVPGGAWTRGSLSTQASVVRLLEALRSKAPGSWSDDRWEQERHFQGITYCALHRIGEQLTQAEFQVMVRDDNVEGGKRPIKRGERGWDLVEILENPNNDDSFGELLYKINLQMMLTGTSLIWMVPNTFGVPCELYSMATGICIPQPAVNPDYPSGFYRCQPLYPYGPFSSYPTPSTSVGAPIPAEWMLRIKYAHPLLHYEGYSPQTAMRLHLDEIEQMDRSRWYTMKRAVSPSAVLQFDKENAQPLPEEEIERIRSEMENTFQGPENHGQFYVATPGAKLEPWGTAPRDMEYQAGWDQLVSFVLGAGFGITKPVAGMIDDSSYSTLFASMKQFHLTTLGPICTRIAKKFTKHLAPFYGDDLVVDIKCQKIDDHDVLDKKLNTLARNGCLTVDEMRKAENWPEVGGAWGQRVIGSPIPGEEAAAPELKEPKPKKEVYDNGQPSEIEAEREQPGEEGQGSLGPRKSLKIKHKGLAVKETVDPSKVYEEMKLVLSNGCPT